MVKVIVLGGVLASAAWLMPCAGQEFPQRTVQIVVPYPAGGVADTQARLIAQGLSERWTQSVIIENKSGGLTIPGTAAVAKAAPDCHTILLSGPPVPLLAISGRSLPYDTATQLAPVSHITIVPNLLVVPASSPIHRLAELVDHARRNPGKLTYGSTGIGGTSHLAAELLAAAAGIEIVHVPYRGGAAAAADLMTGRVDMMFDSSSAENVRAGRLRALAVTSEQRIKEFPDIPTVAEQGYPGFSASAWFAIWTTGGSPAACINKLSGDINSVLKDEVVQNRFATLGASVVGTSPEGAARFLESESKRWGDLIRQRGLKLE
jgi:tripartite-type tricarboxylate transporter receptor subunit TctC